MKFLVLYASVMSVIFAGRIYFWPDAMAFQKVKTKIAAFLCYVALAVICLKIYRHLE